MKQIFEFSDYRAFLNDQVAFLGKGAKSKLARAAECQPAYLSQVFSGSTDLSPEQAERIGGFLGLSETQKLYFLLLVSKERAGTTALKRTYDSELNRLRDSQLVLKNRVQPKKVLSLEEQAQFYSSWHYGVIHVSVSIPGCETENGLAEKFQLPLKRVNEVVEFLTQTGLIQRNKNGELEIGSTTVFIGSDSPLISKHHSNWRVRAIESLDNDNPQDLHYSGVMTCSYEDMLKIREKIIQCIQDMRGIIAPSPSDACFSYGFDLFEMGQTKK